MKEKIKVDISDAVCVENKVWCISKSFSCLFCIDLDLKKVVYIEEIPEASYYEINSFLQLREFNNRIYCVPYNEKSIIVYDIKKNTFEIIKIDEKIIQYKGVGGLFAGAAVYNKYLFLLPAFCKAIIRLDMESHEVIYITEWVEQIKDFIFDENEYYFMRQSVIREGKLFVPFVGANAVLEFDCINLKSNIHILGEEHEGYSGITYDGKTFWMSKRMIGELISWNSDTNVIKTVYLNKENKREHWNDCIGLIYDDELIKFLPMLKENNIESNIENIVKEDGQYLFVKEEKNSILYYEDIKGELTIIDKRTKCKRELNVLIDKNVINTERLFEKNKVMFEIDKNGLDMLFLKLKK